jgi:hypothetical protein|tara:strand:+ start:756 stop:1415 length:660 start_codon:yes stop_codon:yes gene_type:complete
MSKSSMVTPMPPETVMGMKNPKTDIIGSSLKLPPRHVNARSNFEKRVTGGRSMAENYLGTRRGDIRGRADAVTNMQKRQLREQAKDQDRASKFSASRAGQFGGQAYLDQLKKDKRSQSRAMQQANLSGLDYETGQLGALNQDANYLRGAAEAGDITGGAFPGIGGYDTSLGGFAKLPKVAKRAEVKKTTAPKKEDKFEPEGGTGGDGPSDGGTEGGIAG